jgi:Phage Mu protein F like protein
MQNAAQALVVVRDQFALKNLSDDVLRQILPAYQEAFRRLQFLLANLPPEGESIARELWLRTQLATIQAQFAPVADRIYQVLPEAQARAFEEGLSNAQKYLEAGGITPEPVPTATFAGVTTGGQSVSVSGNLPGFNVTKALEKGFMSPSITRQQVIAAARETGFSVLSPGGSKYGLAELLPKYTSALGKQVADKLRAGFLLGLSNDEIERQVISITGELGPGRKGRAMTEAVVRTAMAEASQSAHDAFYEANADLLPGTKSGYRWWWDASNDTRLCPECAPLDGVKFKERDRPPHAWPAHFSCRCKILPWTATMELLEEEDGPASGSFLEATPVEYDSRGRRKEPPAGYTGDNAYKRPMKVDGQMQWVRRRDLGPGQTTAGDMLQNANEHSKKLVLGKHTDAFNKLTGPGGRYEKNPQGAVRELLGKGLPPEATPPRPVRGPKPTPVTPKPKAAPKPAAKPLTLEQEGKAFMDKTTPQLNSYLSISRKSEAVMKRRVEAMQAATTPEAKEKARKAYLRAAEIEERAYEKTRPAMEALRNQMLKTDLPEKVVKEYVNGVNLAGYGTKRDLKKQVKEHVEEFVRMFNGQGFTATGPASWVRQIEPDLNGRGFNRGDGTLAARVNNKRNLWHEIMHTVEHQRPWMGELAREWASGRAFAADDPRLPANLAGKATGTLRGKPVYGLADIQVGTGYRDGEWAWVDNYQNPYMGKYYPNTSEGVVSSEVWTVAVEHFADVRNMHSLFRKHPDLFKMLVGLSQRGR